MNNWDGNGTDLILSYHRGGETPATLYDGAQKVIAQFPHSGNLVDNAATRRSLRRRQRRGHRVQRVAVWIYANGGCNLDDPPAHPVSPSSSTCTNWSEIHGMDHARREVLHTRLKAIAPSCSPHDFACARR